MFTDEYDSEWIRELRAQLNETGQLNINIRRPGRL